MAADWVYIVLGTYSDVAWQWLADTYLFWLFLPPCDWLVLQVSAGNKGARPSRLGWMPPPGKLLDRCEDSPHWPERPWTPHHSLWNLQKQRARAMGKCAAVFHKREGCLYWCIVRTVLTGKRCFGRLAILFVVFENTQRQVYGLIHYCLSTREEAVWMPNIYHVWPRSQVAFGTSCPRTLGHAVRSGCCPIRKSPAPWELYYSMSIVCFHNHTAVRSLDIQVAQRCWLDRNEHYSCHIQGTS